MNTRPSHPVNLTILAQSAAFTRTALVVVIAVTTLLAIVLAVALRQTGAKSDRMCCICNFKQIGTAYRIWANDHGDQFPSEASPSNGGWNDSLSQADAGQNCWKNYVCMSNELGQSPLILVCPTDERQPVPDFKQITNNLSLSYFVGPHINADAFPQGILGGDRNLAPGTIPKKDYGYSPDNGQGNDVVIKSPVCWSLKMHSMGSPYGAGNILLGDGSAQQTASTGFRQNWLKPALEAAATNSIPVRLIFP
jgi:hypothetical protein